MSKPTPTPAKLAKVINTTYGKLKPLMLNLAARAKDEPYEPASEYAAHLAKQLPASMVLLKVTKRPFKFTFMLPAFPNAQYAIGIKGQDYYWKRIK